MIKLKEGSKYETRFGVLTYTGFCRGSNFGCDGCKKERWSVHEFLKGEYPAHTEIYHYGSECVKDFLKDAKEVVG